MPRYGPRLATFVPRLARRIDHERHGTTKIADARSTERSGPRDGVAGSVRARLPERWRDNRSVLGLASLVAIAAVSLLYPSSPGYDPWAWLIWGREIAELDLSTDNGPSWKPLPVAFTTVFSFAGDAAPALWLLVARAGGLLALAMAFRVAARLAGRMGTLAGVVAVLGVLLAGDFFALSARGWSEPLLAGFVLLAFERHLDGARRTAFGLVFAAALIRPEVWPFLALYGVYLWRRDPARRPLIVVLLLLVPVLWFGPDLVASGDPLRSQVRAQDPLPGRPALAEHPALEVLRQGRELLLAPIQILAALAGAYAAVAFARRRTEGATLVVALGCVAWVAIVAVMAEFGYTGNPRYLVPAAVGVCVLAGVGAALLIEGVLLGLERTLKRPIGLLPASLAASIVLLAALAPSGSPAIDELKLGAKRVRSQGEVPADLEDAVRMAGGRERLLACGDVFTGPFQVPLAAWTLRIPIRDVSSSARSPGVVFRVRPKALESEPPSPVAAKDPFRLVARTPRWEVLTSCSA